MVGGECALGEGRGAGGGGGRGWEEKAPLLWPKNPCDVGVGFHAVNVGGI